jgi:hypothetical protein
MFGERYLQVAANAGWGVLALAGSDRCVSPE